MAECIDRKSAIDVVARWFKEINLNGDICIDGLRSLPAADVVEVVRCKDCFNHTKSGMCIQWSRYEKIVNTPDYAFCSWRVKKYG